MKLFRSLILIHILYCSCGTGGENSSDFKELLRKISGIDGDKRDLLIMRFVDEFGPKEIAQILGESENVISVRLSRALKEVKDLYNHGK